MTEYPLKETSTITVDTAQMRFRWEAVDDQHRIERPFSVARS